MKSTIISVGIAILLIAGAFYLGGGAKSIAAAGGGNNVSMADGTQIIDIHAKGGYFPAVSEAKADTPSLIRVTTSGSFDCSSALVIPSLGYRRNLPPSGVTDVEIPPQAPGTTMRGMCAMGMYNFEVRFN